MAQDRPEANGGTRWDHGPERTVPGGKGLRGDMWRVKPGAASLSGGASDVYQRARRDHVRSSGRPRSPRRGRCRWFGVLAKGAAMGAAMGGPAGQAGVRGRRARLGVPHQLRRIRLGSVGQHCVYHAECPVVVVREQARQHQLVAGPRPGDELLAEPDIVSTRAGSFRSTRTSRSATSSDLAAVVRNARCCSASSSAPSASPARPLRAPGGAEGVQSEYRAAPSRSASSSSRHVRRVDQRRT
jgi:hypothetical protein